MKTIYKYPLVFEELYPYNLPLGAEILSAGPDPQGTLCVWALVDSDAPTEKRLISVIGTGNPLPDNFGEFVGTVRNGPFMWHVFATSNA